MVSMNQSAAAFSEHTPDASTSLPEQQTFAGCLLQASEIDGLQLQGERVALVGTGARAMLLLPTLVEQASKVTVFQRSARWILPSWPLGKINPLSGAPEAFLGRPLLPLWAQRRARAHLHRAVPERWMRRQLTPCEPIGARPVLISPNWYALLQHPKVKLITWPIVRACPQGIRSVEGIEHHFDTIILATGAG